MITFNSFVKANPVLLNILHQSVSQSKYEGWNFNSGNYLFTTDTK